MSFHDQNENQIEEQFVSARACRNLWVGVLLQMFKLAFQPSANDRAYEIQQAQNWFGTKDFAIVCEFAGLDPRCVWEGVQPYLACVRGVA